MTGPQPRPVPTDPARRPFSARPQWQRAAAVTIGFVVLLWVLEIIDVMASHRFDQWGIAPRQASGLKGIAFAPLLHFGFGHLVANTGPLLILGFALAMGGIGRAVWVTLVVWLVGGAGVWLTGGTGTIVAGASILVFGWLAYLIVRGLFTRHWGDLLLGVVIAALYGTMLFGVLPTVSGVSWQAHLFGALGGVLAAAAVGAGDGEDAAAGSRAAGKGSGR